MLSETGNMIIVSLSALRKMVQSKFIADKFANKKTTAALAYLALSGVYTKYGSSSAVTYKDFDTRISGIGNELKIGDIAFLIDCGMFVIISIKPNGNYVGFRIKLVSDNNGSVSYGLSDLTPDRSVREFSASDAFFIRESRFDIDEIRSLYIEYRDTIQKVRQLEKNLSQVYEKKDEE